MYVRLVLSCVNSLIVLFQDFIVWLLSIVKYLTSISEVRESGWKMCSILSIICLLERTNNYKYDPHQVASMFSLLRLRPELNPPRCMDLDTIMTFIPQGYHLHVANILLSFTSKVLPNAYSGIAWVYIIPLIHVLLKKVQPYERPHLTSSSICWVDENFLADKIDGTSRNSIAR